MEHEILQDRIEKKIFIIRGCRVMLDSDLAELYGIETFNLNKAVKRNLSRFPEDFMFQLTESEFKSLIFHIGMSKEGRGGRRYLPYAFTEQGVAMLSSVLNSKQAIQVNIAIMRAFIRLKTIISAHKELGFKIQALERKVGSHDADIQLIFEAIRKLMEPPSAPPKPRIGFK